MLSGGLLDLGEGTTLGPVYASAELGGGVGVLAGTDGSQNVVVLDDVTVADTVISGLFLNDPGAYEVTNSTLEAAEPVEAYGRLWSGNAVFAQGGITAQLERGALGLYLSNNTFYGSQTAAVLLDASSATLEGNTYDSNVVDLAWQSCDTDTVPPDDYREADTISDCPVGDNWFPYVPASSLDLILNSGDPDVIP